MAMSKLLISVWVKKMWLRTTKLRAYAGRLSTSHQKFCSVKATEKPQTGGHTEASFTKCCAASHLFTIRTRRSCSETSNITSPDLTSHFWAKRLEISVRNFLTRTHRRDLALESLTQRRSWLTPGSPALTGILFSPSSSQPLISPNLTTSSVWSTSHRSSPRWSWRLSLSPPSKTTASGQTSRSLMKMATWKMLTMATTFDHFTDDGN